MAVAGAASATLASDGPAAFSDSVRRYAPHISVVIGLTPTGFFGEGSKPSFCKTAAKGTDTVARGDAAAVGAATCVAETAGMGAAVDATSGACACTDWRFGWVAAVAVDAATLDETVLDELTSLLAWSAALPSLAALTRPEVSADLFFGFFAPTALERGCGEPFASAAAPPSVVDTGACDF